MELSKPSSSEITYAAVSRREPYPELFGSNHNIEEIPVRCLSVGELLHEQRIPTSDVAGLIIDCQGMDGQILQGIDFAALGLRPAFIFYEHKEMKIGERQSTLEHLWNHGYSCWRWEGGNTWCLPVGYMAG